MINSSRRDESRLQSAKPNGRRSVATKTSRYEILKDKIRTWWNDRLMIGESLKEIRDDKLWQKEYASFEEFCIEEFDIKHSQAYALIQAVGVKESIARVSAIAEKITNEGQARALARVPEEKRVEVLTEAAKAPGPVTARRITEVAQSNGHAKTKPIEAKAVHLDKTGYPIPESVLEDWNRADEVSRRMLSQVSNLKSELKAGLAGDVIFREVTNTTVADFSNAYTSLKCVVPYAVCTSCQGNAKKKCSLCRGRGFVSEFAWRSYVTAEAKELREKIVKK